MEDFLFYNNLYACYKELLTNNEQEVFNDYYLEDLSMQEIAENNMVSKSAIHKTIKVVKDKLVDYENKLHLNEITTKISDVLNYEDINKIKEELQTLVGRE